VSSGGARSTAPAEGAAALAHRAAATSADIDAALAADDLREVARAVAGAGVAEDDGARLVAGFATDPWARDTLTALKRRLHDAGALPSATALERLLLLRAMRTHLDRVRAVRVSPAVHRLFYEEFSLCARPDARRAPLFALGLPTFSATCEVATLARFPAGQLHWNVSGLPRRTLAEVSPARLPRVLWFVLARMRGFAPAFFSHANGLRRNRFIWVEEESNRSYHRMAASLELQPATVGLVTSSWFHDPEVATTSPHLAWTNRVIVENGGLVVRLGEAPADAGFLDNNESRRAAYEAGTYRPHLGLVLWPRDAMIDWARRNPQYADAG